MNVAAQGDVVTAVVDRMRRSRFFTVSLLIHVVLVVLFGGTVLFHKYAEPADFTSEGGDGGFVTDMDAGQQPPDATNPVDQTPNFTVTAPSAVAPAATMTAITTASATATSFTMNAAPIAVPNMSESITEKVAAAVSKMPAGIGNLPGAMAGRSGERRGAAMAAKGGKSSSDEAVLKGLRWLKKVQNPDGTWGEKFKGAMTGLAVLSFLGHGEIPSSREFGDPVRKGIDALLAQGAKSDGWLHFKGKGSGGNAGSYEHPIASYTLGEAYSMTKDERIAPILTQAIGYIVKGQRPDGGWAYGYSLAAVPAGTESGSSSDTSVCGWQIQALKAAHLTELPIEGADAALEKSALNMERVYNKEKEMFGYRGASSARISLTGVGVLSLLIATGKEDRMVRDGLKSIVNGKPVDYAAPHADLYTWYYHTQATFMAEGAAWSKWNRMFQDQIVKAQSKDGSWPPHGGNEHGGMNEGTIDAQVYRATLCILMLEVYYRYLPTSKGVKKT